jgi:hypothetical protein
MRKILAAAGTYYLAFGMWSIGWPHLWFDWTGLARPNHPLMWQGVGLVLAVLGAGLLLAAKDPIRHWLIVLIAFGKSAIGAVGFGYALFRHDIPFASAWLTMLPEVILLLPLGAILWAGVRAHTGVPPTRSTPFTVAEAAANYQISEGVSLADASRKKLLALVFLRHFGCTFTRQILRELEGIQREAREHGADLVLVHMLQRGRESAYLGENGGVSRIADPRCELYRAFGLGKGGFLELFGPRVWWRGAVSIFKGCGVGHLAGDGLQMPGAFLFRDGEIVSSQRARSASDLPDLPGLFREMPPAAPRIS